MFFPGLDSRPPLPPGVSMLPVQKQRVPPPPGEDTREVRKKPCMTQVLYWLFHKFMLSLHSLILLFSYKVLFNYREINSFLIDKCMNYNYFIQFLLPSLVNHISPNLELRVCC